METLTFKNERILKLPETEKRSGYKRASIYAKMKTGEFPQSIKLGANAVGWLESEIDAWIAARVQASRNQ